MTGEELGVSVAGHEVQAVNDAVHFLGKILRDVFQIVYIEDIIAAQFVFQLRDEFESVVVPFQDLLEPLEHHPELGNTRRSSFTEEFY